MDASTELHKFIEGNSDEIYYFEHLYWECAYPWNLDEITALMDYTKLELKEKIKRLEYYRYKLTHILYEDYCKDYLVKQDKDIFTYIMNKECECSEKYQYDETNIKELSDTILEDNMCDHCMYFLKIYRDNDKKHIN